MVDMTTTQAAQAIRTGTAFRMTVINADGTTAEGAYTEADAMCSLRRAVRRGYRVEATRNGGVVITREIPSAGDTWAPARKHVVTLEPVAVPGKITGTMRHDLDLIAIRGGSLLANGRIKAGYFYGIPPAASARLIARGFVTVRGTAVAVSLSARLAMLAQDHQTTTREQRGYVRPGDIGLSTCGANGGGRSGLVYDRSSGVTCACRWSLPTEDRETARRLAHEHRQQATAALVGTLAGTEG
jgi:hypothetical protein